MLLITMAHRGEAQEFIKRKYTQPTEFYFRGIYRSNEDILLLTGEGIQSTTIRLTAVCTYFGNKIDRVINMGIAGALDPALQLNQIYGIRRVCHEFSDNPEYGSFQCVETFSKYDCITACRRVNDDKYAADLKNRAQIVDRELWAIGSVSSHFNLPFKSYKLISDYAGKITDSGQIRENAFDYSKHLFDFYKNLSFSKEEWEDN